MERGVPIRSISRCIAVLQAINRHGSLSLMDVARMANLPYPTACRMIQTLMHEGMIECEPNRKCYRATALVHTLSQGFNNHDRLVMRARPFIVALTRKVGWPLAVMTRVGQLMMVRDSTFDLTSLTFNTYAPGYTMPLLECASGQVYLAHVQDDERRNIIEGLEQFDTKSPLLPLFRLDRTIARIRKEGFSTYERNPHSANPGKTSSISVPIFDHARAAGSLTLIFFTSSMPMSDALTRYLEDMREAAESISQAISAETSDPAQFPRAPANHIALRTSAETSRPTVSAAA